MAERVIVGMSGGVDSSVAAYLLQSQGYEVIGVTMQVWDAACSLQMEREGGCCGQGAVDDARRVCAGLGIPYYVMGFRDIFEDRVIRPFIEEYLRGRTPNPCIVCNRDVKWAAMMKARAQVGASYVATGHYARIEKLENGRYTIKNSVTAAKDQTYALYRLSQEQLAATLMPVGDYEICFVTDDDYAGYIDAHAEGRVPGPGRFVTKDGRDLGPNKGITHYTIGQRKHLGLSMGHPVFVTDIDAKTGNVTIGDDADVYGTELVCSDLNFMAVPDMEIGETVRLSGKIRYGGKPAPCTVEKTGGPSHRGSPPSSTRAITSMRAARSTGRSGRHRDHFGKANEKHRVAAAILCFLRRPSGRTGPEFGSRKMQNESAGMPLKNHAESAILAPGMIQD